MRLGATPHRSQTTFTWKEYSRIFKVLDQLAILHEEHNTAHDASEMSSGAGRRWGLGHHPALSSLPPMRPGIRNPSQLETSIAGAASE
jgi:hypothetical protein